MAKMEVCMCMWVEKGGGGRRYDNVALQEGQTVLFISQGNSAQYTLFL